MHQLAAHQEALLSKGLSVKTLDWISLKSQDGGAVALLIEAKLLSSSSFATVQPQVSSFVCNLLQCACHDITLVFP